MGVCLSARARDGGGVGVGWGVGRWSQDYAIKAQKIWNYHLPSEDQNKKNTYFDWQETENVDTGGGDQVRGGVSCAQV